MMIIQPKVRGFICTSAHPQGCFKNVEQQVNYVKSKGQFSVQKCSDTGASTGYGLASRIVAAFGQLAQHPGGFFERPADGKRTASAGWYNTAAFEYLAHESGVLSKSINGDAFSQAIKDQTIAALKDMGPVDLVVYSLAAPRRTHPDTGEAVQSYTKANRPKLSVIKRWTL